MLSLEQALEQLLSAVTPIAGETVVDLLDAMGRVLARPVVSGIDVPAHDNSSMDGYAVRSADVGAAGVTLQVSQRIPAGSVGAPLAAGTAARIFTGAPVPDGADAIVMQELCDHSEGLVTLRHAPTPGEWIRRRGEDIAEGAEVLPAGTRMGPAQLGLAASIGVPALAVKPRLRVATFSTGDELLMPGEPTRPGAIYNSNRYTLRGLLHGLGCEIVDLGRVRDTLEATRAALREAAAQADLIITSGGVSVGEEDHVKPAVEAEGALTLHKVAIKPGKPLAFGHVQGGGGRAWFVGLPGNPVSTFVTFLLLVRPLILQLQGASQALPRGLSLRADFDAPRAEARREFLRARYNDAGGLDLFANQSSGVLTSCAWADGLIDNPAGVRIERGQMVRFLPFSELMG